MCRSTADAQPGRGGLRLPDCPRATLSGAGERDYRAVLVTDAVSGWNDQSAGEVAAIGVHTSGGREIARELERSA